MLQTVYIYYNFYCQLIYEFHKNIIIYGLSSTDIEVKGSKLIESFEFMIRHKFNSQTAD